MSKVPLTIVAFYSAALEGTISILQMILHLSIYRDRVNNAKAQRMTGEHMAWMTGIGSFFNLLLSYR